jgi:thioredoxin-like negative regulator of GroEL
VDIQESPIRSANLGVKTVPTFIFFSEGREIRRSKGNLSEREIRFLFRPADAFF